MSAWSTNLHIVIATLYGDDLEWTRVLAGKDGSVDIENSRVGNGHLGVFLTDDDELVLTVFLDLPSLMFVLTDTHDEKRLVTAQSSKAAFVEADLVGALLDGLGCCRHDVESFVVEDSERCASEECSIDSPAGLMERGGVK